MTEQKKRFLEAEFIKVCWDIYTVRQNILDMLHFIEGICQLGDFKELRIKKLIQRVFANDVYKPTDRQWVKLLIIADYTPAEISKITGCSRQTVWNMKKYEEQNLLPPHFIYNLNDKDYDTLEAFLNLLHKIQEVGIPHAR